MLLLLMLLCVLGVLHTAGRLSWCCSYVGVSGLNDVQHVNLVKGCYQPVHGLVGRSLQASMRSNDMLQQLGSGQAEYKVKCSHGAVVDVANSSTIPSMIV